MYGFKKIKTNDDTKQYYNPQFNKENPYLLNKIKRKNCIRKIIKNKQRKNYKNIITVIILIPIYWKN